MDINLSSDDETMHLLVPDAPADKKVPAGDDIGGEGATSVEPIAPSLIGSGAPKKPNLLPLIGSLLSHPLAGVAKNTYMLLLGGPTHFLKLIR
jgi:hypothetical protein